MNEQLAELGSMQLRAGHVSGKSSWKSWRLCCLEVVWRSRVPLRLGRGRTEGGKGSVCAWSGGICHEIFMEHQGLGI